jgi:hypothetical protein
MKKINLLLGLIFFVLMSCGSGSDKSENKSKSDEPNNTIEEATEVKAGDEIKMSIAEKGDVDWYKVEVKKQGYLQALAKGIPEDLAIQMRFAKYDEWGDEKEDFISGWSEMPTTIQVLEEGTYYIMVAERWGDKFSEEEFTLKIEFIEEFDTFEPNVDALSAKDVEFENEYKSAIFPLKDQDWFKVNVEEKGYLEVKSKDVDEEIELSVYFAQFDEYNEDPVDVLKSKKVIPQALAVSEPGEYYIVLVDRWDSKMSQNLFNWVVNFIPEMDEFEPNNSDIDAKEITGNETVNLAVFPLDDVDIFKFSPANTGTLSIKGKDFGDIEVAAVIYIFDEDNELDELETIVIPGKFEVKDAGKDYFIGIKDRYDSNSSPELLELIFSF